MLIAKLFPGHVYRGYLMAGQIPRNDDKFAPRILFSYKTAVQKILWSREKQMRFTFLKPILDRKDRKASWWALKIAPTPITDIPHYSHPLITRNRKTAAKITKQQPVTFAACCNLIRLKMHIIYQNEREGQTGKWSGYMAYMAHVTRHGLCLPVSDTNV